jgi:hypothetical protein
MEFTSKELMLIWDILQEARDINSGLIGEIKWKIDRAKNETMKQVWYEKQTEAYDARERLCNLQYRMEEVIGE